MALIVPLAVMTTMNSRAGRQAVPPRYGTSVPATGTVWSGVAAAQIGIGPRNEYCVLPCRWQIAVALLFPLLPEFCSTTDFSRFNLTLSMDRSTWRMVSIFFKKRHVRSGYKAVRNCQA